MTWEQVAPQLFEIVVYPLLGALALFLCVLITNVIKKMKDKTDSDIGDKYLDMLDKTITSCVIATTQTYVDALKREGKFDAEAQKKALEQTYQNVMKILTQEAKVYLQTAVGDLNAYILTKIESEVKLTKSIK